RDSVASRHWHAASSAPGERPASRRSLPRVHPRRHRRRTDRRRWLRRWPPRALPQRQTMPPCGCASDPAPWHGTSAGPPPAPSCPGLGARWRSLLPAPCPSCVLSLRLTPCPARRYPRLSHVAHPALVQEYEQGYPDRKPQREQRMRFAQPAATFQGLAGAVGNEQAHQQDEKADGRSKTEENVLRLV